MLRFNHLLLILLYGPLAFGQGWLDSVRVALKQEPSFTIALNNRSTFVVADKLTLYGLEAGFSYGDDLRIYGGLYGLSNRRTKWLVNDPRFEEDSVLRSSSMGNLSVGAEFTVHRNGGLRIRIPVQLGFGTLRTRYAFTTGSHIDEHHLMVPLEVGTHASYRMFRYLSLSGGLGYRIQLGSPTVLGLSGPYFSLGFGLALQTLYQDMKADY